MSSQFNTHTHTRPLVLL